MSKSEPTVQKYMTTQPVSIGVEETLEAARKLLSKFSIRHLPATKDGKLVGIVSEREINLACGIDSIDPRQLLVADICSEKPYIVEPDTPLREVAKVMASQHYGSAIVVQNGKLVGIFTTVDACRALAQTIQLDIDGANLMRAGGF